MAWFEKYQLFEKYQMVVWCHWCEKYQMVVWTVFSWWHLQRFFSMSPYNPFLSNSVPGMAQLVLFHKSRLVHAADYAFLEL